MSEPNSLEARIARIFETRLNLVVPSVETDLFDTGALDSLSFVELLVHLEREFGMQIPFADVELDYFRSIARIATFIAGRHDSMRLDNVRSIKHG